MLFTNLQSLSSALNEVSTTFFLVNSFKQRIVPVLFPHAVAPPPPPPLPR